MHSKKNYQEAYAHEEALLSANATGEIELTDTDLEAIYGGVGGAQCSRSY